VKVVIQRSLNSKVIVDDKIVGEISNGMVLLVCFEKGDNLETIKKSSEKIQKLRIFTDETTGKMNKGITEVGGSFLAISQFTLSWDGAKGNRPSFDNSLEPSLAEEYFELFCLELEKTAKVEKGVFGRYMDVRIKNDGPVTFSLDF
tara:strand:+ start:1243 stop:1680 length:438 start_codon:yes stop_codon:yes gene_type:complete